MVSITAYVPAFSPKLIGFLPPYRNILLSYFVWLTATRTLKLMPHLWNNPGHIIYVPAFILFGYYFAIMKLYALFTLHEVGLRSIFILRNRSNQIF